MCGLLRGPARARQAKRWPKLAEAYRRASHRAFARRVERGDPMTWRSGDDMYNAWLTDDRHRAPKGQPPIEALSFDDPEE